MPSQELAGTGVTLRDAGPGDAVCGVTPTWVALPETTGEVSAVLRACAEHDLAVVPTGGGTKLHWGPAPERCDVLLDLCCMNEIVEHAAGDLVVRAQAGVTMEALSAALAERGQELALDPPFAEGSTVGGTLAAAVAGPRAFRYGTARDLLIGITVVLPDGTIAKSGGKVVKNVAGYDLGKLFTGSFGTLGVIAEATFRLHPLPVERRWIVAVVDPPRVSPAEPCQAGELAAMLAAAQQEPSAVELDWPHGQGPIWMTVLVEGTAAHERARVLRARMGGVVKDVRDEPPPNWGLILNDDVLAEVRFEPAELTRVLDAVHYSGFSLRGSAVAGRVWLELWGDHGADKTIDAVAALRARLDDIGARLTVLATPYEGVERWGAVGSLPLMRRVKERFDPGRRMSPGRFVGGI
ncbi:FAD-binding oxidoreductase [Nonomuraea glycinis]|uniref:FAD-linked oxidase n=1 Tax=Nonomuraea glycinis TaxID=2047744 RepID=A0A918A9U5_9ACTN|nr:FAD-binding oxidoreductase [Nonomuraea glycinis]MCA2183003.1 FAD-binding oxidoreductase [Nonomuraea glycinis]GGP11630.1 FAD-linked oxidase [Nonomuraea glycinis]